VWGAALLVMALTSGSAPATAAPLTDDPMFRVASSSRLAVDGGLLVGLPAALGTGLSTGVGAGVTVGERFAWGARVSWSTATESSLTWTVTQADLRLRATAAVQQRAGRGRFALRLGLGPTIVHESRLRNQGARAGLTGGELQTSAWVTLPAADLDGVVALHVAGPWLFLVGGGPSLTVIDGGARWGWTAQLGAGWQP
jgi:hypothetical protein